MPKRPKRVARLSCVYASTFTMRSGTSPSSSSSAGSSRAKESQLGQSVPQKSTSTSTSRGPKTSASKVSGVASWMGMGMASRITTIHRARQRPCLTRPAGAPSGLRSVEQMGSFGHSQGRVGPWIRSRIPSSAPVSRRPASSAAPATPPPRWCWRPNAPDIDVVYMFLGEDPALLHRRGLTHGIISLALLPFLLAGGMMLFARWRERRGDPGTDPARFLPLLGLATIGVLSHPLLDWMNSYGVRVLMPFDGRWFYRRRLEHRRSLDVAASGSGRGAGHGPGRWTHDLLAGVGPGHLARWSSSRARRDRSPGACRAPRWRCWCSGSGGTAWRPSRSAWRGWASRDWSSTWP